MADSQPKFWLACEELEIEKLLGGTDEDKPSSGSDYDNLYEETQQVMRTRQLKETAAPADTDDTNTSSEPAEDPDADNIDDGNDDDGSKDDEQTDVKKDGEKVTGDPEAKADDDSDVKSEDEADKKIPDKVSAESLRLLSRADFGKGFAVYANENVVVDGVGVVGSIANAGAHALRAGAAVGNLAVNAAQYLTVIGVDLAHMAAPHIYRGVVYGFSKLGQGIAISVTAVSNYIERRVKSFNRLKSSIDSAIKTLDLIDNDVNEKPTPDPSDANAGLGVYNSRNVIASIKIGQSLDIARNTQVMSVFLTRVINEINEGVKQDNEVISRLVAAAGQSAHVKKEMVLDVTIPFHELKEGAVPGYEDHSDNPHIQAYHAAQVLPGDAVLIGIFPKKGLASVDEYKKAYNDSQMFLGVYTGSIRPVDSMPYVDSAKLRTILVQLSALCDVAISHQQFYENIKSQKLKMRYAYKNYFQTLARSKTKVTLADSFVELVRMRNAFTDKVYIPAAIDIHDHTARYIDAVLRYVAKNIKSIR